MSFIYNVNSSIHGMENPYESSEFPINFYPGIHWTHDSLLYLKDIYNQYILKPYDCSNKEIHFNLDTFYNQFTTQPNILTSQSLTPLAEAFFGKNQINFLLFLQFCVLCQIESPHNTWHTMGLQRIAAIHRRYDKGLKGYLNMNDINTLLDDIYSISGKSIIKRKNDVLIHCNNLLLQDNTTEKGFNFQHFLTLIQQKVIRGTSLLLRIKLYLHSGKPYIVKRSIEDPYPFQDYYSHPNYFTDICSPQTYHNDPNRNERYLNRKSALSFRRYTMSDPNYSITKSPHEYNTHIIESKPNHINTTESNFSLPAVQSSISGNKKSYLPPVTTLRDITYTYSSFRKKERKNDVNQEFPSLKTPCLGYVELNQHDSESYINSQTDNNYKSGIYKYKNTLPTPLLKKSYNTKSIYSLNLNKINGDSISPTENNHKKRPYSQLSMKINIDSKTYDILQDTIQYNTLIKSTRVNNPESYFYNAVDDKNTSSHLSDINDEDNEENLQEMDNKNVNNQIKEINISLNESTAYENNYADPINNNKTHVNINVSNNNSSEFNHIGQDELKANDTLETNNIQINKDISNILNNQLIQNDITPDKDNPLYKLFNIKSKSSYNIDYLNIEQGEKKKLPFKTSSLNINLMNYTNILENMNDIKNSIHENIQHETNTKNFSNANNLNEFIDSSNTMNHIKEKLPLYLNEGENYWIIINITLLISSCYEKSDKEFINPLETIISPWGLSNNVGDINRDELINSPNHIIESVMNSLHIDPIIEGKLYYSIYKSMKELLDQLYSPSSIDTDTSIEANELLSYSISFETESHLKPIYTVFYYIIEKLSNIVSSSFCEYILKNESCYFKGQLQLIQTHISYILWYYIIRKLIFTIYNKKKINPISNYISSIKSIHIHSNYSIPNDGLNSILDIFKQYINAFFNEIKSVTPVYTNSFITAYTNIFSVSLSQIIYHWYLSEYIVSINYPLYKTNIRFSLTDILNMIFQKLKIDSTLNKPLL